MPPADATPALAASPRLAPIATAHRTRPGRLSGRLVVVPHLVSRSFEQFYDLVVREGVTVLTHTPTAFKQFALADQLAQSSGRLALRFVVFAGEALNIPGLRPWFVRHGDQVPRLVNMYGITATTVHVTYREIDMADTDNAASVIGGPIPDLQLYILDDDLNPVPQGTVGEIYVGGPGVGRGYLRRPELTSPASSTARSLRAQGTGCTAGGPRHPVAGR